MLIYCTGLYIVNIQCCSCFNTVEYVREIFQTFLEASNEELESAVRHLKDSRPPAMVTMLVKQPRKEALEKREMRKRMVVTNVPPTSQAGMIKCQ